MRKYRYIFFSNLDGTICHPEVADFLAGDHPEEWSPAGGCWQTPQEMKSAKSGDYPHGAVDECGDFQRIWHDPSASWYNTYGLVPEDYDISPPDGYDYREEEYIMSPPA